MTIRASDSAAVAAPHETARRAATIRTLETTQMTPYFSAVGLRSSAAFSLDPFMNLDDFRMSEATFPPHPHAGFSAVTYMFEDSEGAFINRDSLGDRSRIEPGALHWTQAARGMMHEEVPERAGARCHGVQLFVNLREVHKHAAPAAFHVAAADVPEARPQPGVRVRVLAGAFADARSPLTQLLTPVTLLELHLAAGAAVTLPAPSAQTAFLFALRGGGDAGGATMAAHAAARFAADGDAVDLVAGAHGLHALFAAGEPIGEPVVFGGPFAMTRPEDLRAAEARFARGEMGHLAPSVPARR